MEEEEREDVEEEEEREDSEEEREECLDVRSRYPARRSRF